MLKPHEPQAPNANKRGRRTVRVWSFRQNHLYLSIGKLFRSQTDVMKNSLKFYKDFPKEGIVFVDIIPLLQNKKLFAQLTRALSEAVTAPNVVAPEARGFLFAAPLLIAKPEVENLVPIRKSGKLPFAEGDLQAIAIQKEYGADHLYYP